MAADGFSAEPRHTADVHPPSVAPAFHSSILRVPHRAPLRMPYGPGELTGPPVSAFVGRHPREHAADLTQQHAGAPLGERIIVHGLLTDAAQRPMPAVLLEIWQASAPV